MCCFSTTMRFSLVYFSNSYVILYFINNMYDIFYYFSVYNFFAIIGCIGRGACSFVVAIQTKEVHGMCLYFVEILWNLKNCSKLVSVCSFDIVYLSNAPPTLNNIGLLCTIMLCLVTWHY